MKERSGSAERPDLRLLERFLEVLVVSEAGPVSAPLPAAFPKERNYGSVCRYSAGQGRIIGCPSGVDVPVRRKARVLHRIQVKRRSEGMLRETIGAADI